MSSEGYNQQSDSNYYGPAPGQTAQPNEPLGYEYDQQAYGLGQQNVGYDIGVEQFPQDTYVP